MLKRRFSICLFFILTCLFQEGKANERLLEMHNEDAGFSLFDYSGVLEDPSGELSFKQVSEGNYTFLPVGNGLLTRDDFRRGLTRSAYWLRVNMIDHIGESWWFINSWGGLNKKVNVYVRSGKETTFSELQVLGGYRGTTFRFKSEPEMHHTLYLRVQNLQAPLDLTLEIAPISGMLKDAIHNYPVYAVVFGGLLTLAIYNLCYFLYLRDSGFLALAIFIIAFGVELGNFIGIWGYFSITRHYLHYAGTGFGFAAIASLIAVFSDLLALKQNAVKGYLFFRAAFYLCVVLALLAPFIYYGTAAVGVLGLVLIPAAIAVVVTLYLNQYQFLKSMVLSIVIFFVSVIPALLMGVGLIPTYGNFIELTPLALLISLVLISLTQAEKVRNQSEQAERTLAANQAKDEFLTTMSHELRTPMHAVVGAGRLLNMTTLSREQGELVSRLNNSSGHMLSLINDILDLARAESHLVTLEKEPFKLNAVLDSLNKLLSESAKHKGLSFNLKSHFTPFRQVLIGDETRLKQVLLNLLNNAIKFTEQGQVSLTVTPVDISSDSVRLLFEVLDTGVGIQKDKQETLFHPFTQAETSTSRRYGGSGLGLAISHKLVRLMGGELTIESALGNGSRFFFSIDLPLQAVSNEVKETPIITSEIPEPQQLEGLKVLLVDDDEMNRFFGGKLLKACGVNGIVAESGEQALEYLDQQPFDLMLLDISMPGMNGYQTAQEVRSRAELSGLIIVALTAHAIKGERERCLEAGMDDFLAKPFELSDLKNLLHKYAAQQLSVKRGGLH